MGIALEIKNLSKQYRLGQVGSKTLSDDLQRWVAKITGKDDPFSKVGDVNDRTREVSNYVWALRDINLTVEEGEVLGIIGRNGAGKSTLLKILSQVTGPTEGSVKINGRLSSLLEVGTGFHPELSGRENIYLNGAILGMSKKEIDKKFEEIVEFSGVRRYIDTPAKRYSSGMKVRLGFAVAVHLEPEIMIVDEVLAVGDAEFQKRAIEKMKEVSEQSHRTVLFVSHNLVNIRNLCHRCIVMKNGEIDFRGGTPEAITHYLSQTIGRSAIPLSERTDRIGDGRLRFTDITYRDSQGKEVNEAISGEPLTIEISYEVHGKLSPSNLQAAVVIFNDYKERVAAFNSIEMGITGFPELLSSNKLTLNIPRLFLRGGTYSFRVFIAEGSTSIGSMIDNVEDAAELRILPGDLYNIGKLNREGNFAIFPGHFKVE
jgi:lipopolysaccharide transport system ATP-binding protein